MSMQLSVVMIFLSVIYLYNYVNMTNYINFNRPLPLVLEILTFKTRPSAQPFLCCICVRTKSHFQIKGWALSLVLIQRIGGTRKRPIFVCSQNWLLKIIYACCCQIQKGSTSLMDPTFLEVFIWSIFFYRCKCIHSALLWSVFIFKWIFLIIIWVQATYNVCTISHFDSAIKSEFN